MYKHKVGNGKGSHAFNNHRETRTVVSVMSPLWCHLFQRTVRTTANHTVGTCDRRMESDMKDHRHTIANTALNAATVIGCCQVLALPLTYPLVWIIFGGQTPIIHPFPHGKG